MITINTFGEFSIFRDEISLLDGQNYQYKLIKLFKYFLTFKDKRLTPEKIVDDIMDYSETTDPINILRTQISRLRKGIGQIPSFYEIVFSYGYYIFKLNDGCLVDTDIYEEAARKGDEYLEVDKDKARKYYEKVVDLYKGDYLLEENSQIWLISIRYRYERIYLHSLIQLIDLHNEEKSYHKVINLCEEVFGVLGNVETINLYYIEALINLGDINMARYFYENNIMDQVKNLDSHISVEMNKMYSRLFSTKVESTIDFSLIDKKLVDSEDLVGGRLLTLDQFKCIYTMEKGRSSKTDDNYKYFGLITLDCRNFDMNSMDFYTSNMRILERVLKEVLETGDALTYGSDKQMYLILYDRNEIELDKIKKEIRERFHSVRQDTFMDLDIRFRKITSD